jgi:hypothetical protein
VTEPHAGDTFDDDLDLEAPEADALEQHTAADDRDQPARRAQTPFEADDADAAEQDLDAGVDDEDDYR